MAQHLLHLFDGYGIELEYMVVDSDTLDVLPICDRVLHEVSGTYEAEIEMGDLNWSNELALHVIELKTNGPTPKLEPLPARFQEHVRRVNAILEPHGGRLMPTAMHPWMDPERETRLWPHEYSPVYESYNRIFGCRGHGWSNLQSTHINLPFAGDDEFGRLHAAIRLVLPILPAIAAGSPIVGGEASGLMDTRLDFYRRNQKRVPSIIGAIIPEEVYTREDYETEIHGPIYRDIAPFDPAGILRHEWLNSRGAIARFDRGAIEIRVLDIQEYPLADLAIAAAVTALVRTCVEERWAAYNDQAAFPTARLADMFLRSIPDADRTVIDDADYLAMFGWQGAISCTAADLWRHLYATELRGRLERMWHAPLEFILDHGPLARRIMRSRGGDVNRPSLERCYRTLAGCLADAVPFDG